MTPEQLVAIGTQFNDIAIQEDVDCIYGAEITIDTWEDSYPEGTAKLAVAWRDTRGEDRQGWTFYGPDGKVLDVFEPL